MLNNPPSKVQVIEHFKVSKMRVFDYTGSYDVSEIIADKLTESKADAVINLNIVLKTTVGDFFVNLITLGIASARTIMVEGDLVKAPAGLGSILDEKTILAEAANKGDLTAALENLSVSGTTISGIFHQDGRFILVQ